MRHRDRELNRRSFLSRGITGAATIGLCGWKTATADSGPTKAPATNPMKTRTIMRTLGKTGLKAPIVSLGVMNADNPALLRRAYELGVRLFDTAAHYQRGRNEEMVGGVIRELGARDKVVIATKIWVRRNERQAPWKEIKQFYLDTFDASMKRLQVDAVDILYLHDAYTIEDLDHPGVREALAEIKASKRARHIGFSTHANMGALLEHAAQDDFYEVVATAFNYSLYDNARLIQALELAARKGIGLIAMKTQCQQGWYRRPDNTKENAFYDGEISHTALLKWVLRHEHIGTAIPGCTTFEQIETDFTVASNLEYTAEERAFLESRGVKLALATTCRQCDQCRTTCPRAADVATLLRAHMYGFAYGNQQAMGATIEPIETGHGLDACRECDECQARCVQKRVDIAGHIGQLRRYYA
jgi:aryl-alcohol dehydrogenase-like predicted oxidoreductase